jgi:N-acyl-D-amino-acid deacylase
MLDLILRNGMVFDGTGTEGFRADIGIQGEWIREIGDLSRIQARRILECPGLYVAPGFIDMHTHSDLDLFADPQSSPKVRMGVTLELLGQDGISVAPMRPQNAVQVRMQLAAILGDYPMEWRWQRVEDYLRLLHRRTAVNVSYLVPHGALRWWVMGFEGRTATPREVEAMCALLRESIQEGAVGISTGLIYPPCIYADQNELVALATAAAKAGGFWVVHIRNEGDRAEEALQEMLDLARASGCPLHVSHFKVSGRENFSKADRLAAMLERAIRDGIEVTCDQYPYTAGCTVLGACLPPWTHDGGGAETLKRLADPAGRARMREEIEGVPRGMWQSMVRAASYEGIVISSVASSANRDLLGRSLADIARIRKTEPSAALFDLLLEEGMKVAMIVHSQSEDVVVKFMRLPFMTVGTDGVRGAKPHPRLYGTYPRILGRYVREQRNLTWPEAIHRMTGAAASRLGVSDQGLLRAGMRGSITVFDPERVMDRATYEEPTRNPEGIRYVLVNGQMVLDNGTETGILAGRVCSQTWKDGPD